MIRRILVNCGKFKKERVMAESPFVGDFLKERVKVGENPLAILKWITSDHTLSKKKKNRETRSTKALTKSYWVIFTCLLTCIRSISN